MAEIKDCSNCKYHDKHTYEEPCNTCLSKECKAWELWESKESFKKQIEIEDSLEKGEESCS